MATFTGELKISGKQILGHFLHGNGQDDFWATVADLDDRVEGWKEIAKLMVRGDHARSKSL